MRLFLLLKRIIRFLMSLALVVTSFMWYMLVTWEMLKILML